MIHLHIRGMADVHKRTDTHRQNWEDWDIARGMGSIVVRLSSTPPRSSLLRLTAEAVLSRQLDEEAA